LLTFLSSQISVIYAGYRADDSGNEARQQQRDTSKASTPETTFTRRNIILKTFHYRLRYEAADFSSAVAQEDIR
jgi:hypothetical protein